MNLSDKRVSASWGSAGAMSGPPQLKSREEVNGGPQRVARRWGSAGAMSGPPQMKSLKK